MRAALLCIGALLVLACSAHSPGKRNAGSGNGNGCGNGGDNGFPQTCKSCNQADQITTAISTNLTYGSQNIWSPGFNSAFSVGARSATCIFTIDDYGVSLFDADTYDPRYAANYGDFIAAINEAWVMYDFYSTRFFFGIIAYDTCGAYPINIVGTSGPLAGQICGTIASFGTQVFSIGATPVVLAQPITACSPLTNAAAVAGKVVLIVGNSNPDGCFFYQAAQNVAAAGGIAVIIQQQYYAGGAGLGAPPGNTAPIPIIYIKRVDGEALQASLPATVTLTSNITVSTNATFEFAINKACASCPNVQSDFDFITYVPNASSINGPFFNKITTTSDAVFFRLQDSKSGFAYTQFFVFDKQAMLNGTGAILLWTQKITAPPQQSNRHFDAAQIRTPFLMQRAPAFIVGPGPSTLIR